ncbi:alanine--tRNA ligase-related protein, partial [Streptococcus suis]
VVKGGSMGMQNETLSGITEPSNFDYERQELDATLSVIVADNERTEMVSEGEALLVFDQTPFYAEMGGQVADHGVIQNAKGELVAQVTDVQKAPNGQALHTVEVRASLAVG